MKAFAFLALMMLLCAFPSAFAQESAAEKETLVVQARITIIDNQAELDNVRLVYGIPSQNNPEGQFIAKLLGKNLATVFQNRFYMEEFMVTAPADLEESEIEEFYEKADKSMDAVLFLPYLEEATLLVVGEEGGEPVILADLAERLCNIDGKCSENENFLSCPEDCPLEKTDNYCLPESDNVCDPDCVKGLDPDCDGKGLDNGKTPKGLSLEELYFVGVVVAAFAIIAAYNVLKRKKKK